MEKEHIELQCWQCKEDFGYLTELDSKACTSVPCPYCATQCSMDFAPYIDKSIVVSRGPDKMTQTSLNLPKPLLTENSESNS